MLLVRRGASLWTTFRTLALLTEVPRIVARRESTYGLAPLLWLTDGLQPNSLADKTRTAAFALAIAIGPKTFRAPFFASFGLYAASVLAAIAMLAAAISN